MSIVRLKQKLIGEIIELLREQSTQTVLMHAIIAERLGLNTTDHKALDLIVKSNEMTAGRLAEMTNLTTGAITGVVDRLEKAGFVRRVFDTNDRRRVLIQFVPESAERLFSVFAPLQHETNALLKKYTAEELMIIGDFLKRSIEMVENIRMKKI